MLLMRGRALARLRTAAGCRAAALAPRPPSLTTTLLSRGSGVRAAATTTATAAPARPKFCRHCGAGQMQFRVPEGDTHPRELCGACGAIEYRNPKIVVGCIVARGGVGGGGDGGDGGGGPWSEVLLCRRAIEPRLGYWTLPAGYLEVGESSADGAAREALEETGAQVVVARPYAHFCVPAIGQAYLIFLARLKEGGSGAAASTPESLETRWFSVDGRGGAGAVPWGELAFSSVETALRLYGEDVRGAARTGSGGGSGDGGGGERGGGGGGGAFPGRYFRQHHGVIVRQPGAGPNEAGTYQLRDHYWSGGGDD